MGLFAYYFFSKLNSVKQQDADGFAVVSLNRLKKIIIINFKKIIASNRKPLTKCSFKGPSEAGGGEKGAAPSHPSRDGTLLSPRRKTSSPALL